MATDNHEQSQTSSRKSSISSNPRRTTSKTTRTKPLPRETQRPHTPLSTDENGLTSFPSLSPSLANSPVNSPHSTYRFHSLSAPDDAHVSGIVQREQEHGQIQNLFAGLQGEGRSSLFEDFPKNVRQIPGTLHLQSDGNLEHMIKRIGATTLVKRMAEDLAQRDAQITQLQRRAVERERLLRRMLRECEVSNLKIENRLKELESQQEEKQQYRKVSDQSAGGESALQSDASIDEQLSEAFVDILGTNELRNGSSELRHVLHVHGTPTTVGSTKTSGELSRTGSVNSGTTRKSGTIKGWKNFFTSSEYPKDPSRTIRAPLNRTLSAQERLTAIHTASQANLRRQGLSIDLFKPPPRDDELGSSASIKQTGATDGSDTRSTKSGNSFTSWASKLVGGSSPEEERKSVQSTSKGRSRPSSGDGSNKKAAHTRKMDQPVGAGAAAKSAASNKTLVNASDNAKNETRKAIAVIAGSPDEHVLRSSAAPGPMEMDTILPDEGRPPTLLPYQNMGGSSDYLTDRYGFIYDQRRRARQNTPRSIQNRAKRSSKVETVENHRRSWHSLNVRAADTESISSHKSNENVDPSTSSPAFEGNPDQQGARRWQDYLRLSSISSELLSHTPSVNPTTNVITVDEEDSKSQITVSQRGSIIAPKSNPAPSPTHVVSGDAEFAQSAEAEVTGTAIVEDDVVDPVKALLDQLTEIHDASQREKESKWNDFLRKVRTERQRIGEASANNDRRTKGKSAPPEASLLDGEIIGVKSMGIEGKAGRAKWIEFKNLVLNGIPLSLRSKVWSECSGASALRMPTYYDELVAGHPEDETIVQQIAMDIPRTLTDNIYFRQGDGMGKLSQVLLAYAQRNPEVGYCQGMNLIAANLLLIMPTAEDAFWMLATLIEKILPDKYYDHSLLTSRADQAVLRQYVTTVLPRLSGHLDSLSIDLEALTFQWFLSIFTDCLSAEALFRVWDVILCTPADAGGGSTFLFQVALALLKLNEQELLGCTTSAEVYAYINGKMTDHAISIDGLIRASEALRKVVRKEEVGKRRDAVVQADLEMMKERDEARRGKARAKEMAAVAIDAQPLASGQGSIDEATYEASFQPRTPQSVSQDEYEGQLEPVSPMPIDEEVQWRG